MFKQLSVLSISPWRDQVLIVKSVQTYSVFPLRPINRNALAHPPELLKTAVRSSYFYHYEP
jgi:hypothetical protein